MPTNDPLDLEAMKRLAEEAERLVAEASPGPWNYSGIGAFSFEVPTVSDSAGRVIAETQYAGDGPFIAHAGTNYATLAGHVKRLVEEVERRTKFLAEYATHSPDCSANCEAFIRDNPHTGLPDCICGYDAKIVPLMSDIDDARPNHEGRE